VSKFDVKFELTNAEGITSQIAAYTLRQHNSHIRLDPQMEIYSYSLQHPKSLSQNLIHFLSFPPLIPSMPIEIRESKHNTHNTLTLEQDKTSQN